MQRYFKGEFHGALAFLTETLPGRDAPLGSPGGAGPVGPTGADTPLVADWARA